MPSRTARGLPGRLMIRHWPWPSHPERTARGALVPLPAQDLCQTGHLPVNDLEGRLGVRSRGRAGASGGEDQVQVAPVGQGTQGLGDLVLLVRHDSLVRHLYAGLPQQVARRGPLASRRVPAWLLSLTVTTAARMGNVSLLRFRITKADVLRAENAGDDIRLCVLLSKHGRRRRFPLHLWPPVGGPRPTARGRWPVGPTVRRTPLPGRLRCVGRGSGMVSIPSQYAGGKPRAVVTRDT